MSNHSQSDAATLLREGIEAAQSGNRFIARMRLEKAAELEPANADCWIWLAWTSESPKSAMFALRHAMKCSPSDSATKKGLSWVQSLCDFSIASSESDELSAVDDEDTKPIVYKFTDSSECKPEEDGSLVSELADEIAAPPTTMAVESQSTEETNDAEDASFVTEIVNKVNAIRDVFAHLRLDAPDACPPPVPSTTTNEHQPTILAVDDSPTVRKLISITLEKLGYKVVTAEDGMAALQCLSSDQPGLVLTDINMPRLDGYQLCKLIKKQEKTRLIPVIMLSGKDGVFDKLRGRLVGCNDYVTKPFESAEIINKVSFYLPIPQSNCNTPPAN